MDSKDYDSFVVESNRMVIQLQKFIATLISQLDLRNDETLNLKMKCLQLIKNLVLDVIASEDNCHQGLHQYQLNQVEQGVASDNPDSFQRTADGQQQAAHSIYNEVKEPLSFNSIVQLLLKQINFDSKFECSKQILEILLPILCCQDFAIDQCASEYRGVLQLSPLTFNLVIQEVVRCTQQEQMKCVELLKNSLNE